MLIGGGMASDVCKTGGPTLKGLPGGPMVIGDPLDVVRTGGETLLLVLLLFLIVVRIFLFAILIKLCCFLQNFNTRCLAIQFSL